MLHYLTTRFDPKDPSKGGNLCISAGRGGARISHGHAKQFAYVHQTLTLWREIQHNMFKVILLYYY